MSPKLRENAACLSWMQLLSARTPFQYAWDYTVIPFLCNALTMQHRGESHNSHGPQDHGQLHLGMEPDL